MTDLREELARAMCAVESGETFCAQICRRCEIRAASAYVLVAARIARVRAEERERCAKVADAITAPGDTVYDKHAYDVRRIIAAAIRARI